MRKNDPLLGRLRLYVVISGSSRDIPWGLPGSPVKKGFNAVHPAAPRIKDHIVEAAAPYVAVAPYAMSIDVEPFSSKWKERDLDNRIQLVARSADVGPEVLARPDVAPRVSPLFQHEFRQDQAVFHEWDHTKSDSPPELVPAFVEQRAREIGNHLRRRNETLRKIRGGDVDAAVDTLLDTLPIARDEKEKPGMETGRPELPLPDEDESRVVSLRLKQSMINQLRALTGGTTPGEAAMRALNMFLQSQRSVASPASD